MDLEERVRRLETENRLMKKGCILVVGLAAITCGLGAVVQNAPAERIQARRIELVDTEGNVRAYLGESPLDSFAVPGLVLLHENGSLASRYAVIDPGRAVRMEMKAPDGQTYVMLQTQKTTDNGKMGGELKLRDDYNEIAITLGRSILRQNTGIELDTLDADGTFRSSAARLAVSRNGSASVKLGHGVGSDANIQAVLESDRERGASLRLGTHMLNMSSP